MFVRDVCAWCLWVMWLCFYSPSPLFVFQLCYQDMLVKQGLASVGHPVEPRSRCHREIRLVLTTFLAPTPTPAICVRETNLVPEPRRTICLMFDSRREWQADSWHKSVHRHRRDRQSVGPIRNLNGKDRQSYAQSFINGITGKVSARSKVSIEIWKRPAKLYLPIHRWRQKKRKKKAIAHSRGFRSTSIRKQTQSKI